jgi:hypothetical protein
MHRTVIYSAAVHQGRQDLRYLRKIVKKIIRAANLREELSFTSLLQAASPRGPDGDLTDAELRAAGRQRSESATGQV